MKYKDERAKLAAEIPESMRSLTIPHFCVAESISEPTYYEMRSKGLGPKETRYLSAVRITPEARAEWHQMLQSKKMQKAALIEARRRKEIASLGGRASNAAKQKKRRRSA